VLSREEIEVCLSAEALHKKRLGNTGLMLKSSSLHMFLRWNISVDACAREVFKPSKDSASLCVCNEKNIFDFGFHI